MSVSALCYISSLYITLRVIVIIVAAAVVVVHSSTSYRLANFCDVCTTVQLQICAKFLSC